MNEPSDLRNDFSAENFLKKKITNKGKDRTKKKKKKRIGHEHDIVARNCFGAIAGSLPQYSRVRFVSLPLTEANTHEAR